MKSVRVRLAGYWDKAEPDVRISGLRRDADLLLVRQLENRERGKPDRALHPQYAIRATVRSACGVAVGKPKNSRYAGICSNNMSVPTW